jgi:hypothetical protein
MFDAPVDGDTNFGRRTAVALVPDLPPTTIVTRVGCGAPGLASRGTVGESDVWPPPPHPPRTMSAAAKAARNFRTEAPFSAGHVAAETDAANSYVPRELNRHPRQEFSRARNYRLGVGESVDGTFGFRDFVEPLSWEVFRPPAGTAEDDECIRYLLAIAADEVWNRRCDFPVRAKLFVSVLAVQEIIKEDDLRRDFASKIRERQDELVDLTVWLKSGCGGGVDRWIEFFNTVIRPLVEEAEHRRKRDRGVGR